MTRGPIVAAALLLLTASSVRARDTEQERATLKGLQRVHVAVYVDASAGVSPSTLQTDVEQALQHAGLHVITETQLHSAPDAGLLIVSVGSVENKLAGSDSTVGYAYETDVSLWQITMLGRAKWIRTYSATWQAPARLGTCGPSTLPAEVAKSVGMQVSQFLAAYRGANSPKAR